MDQTLLQKLNNYDESQILRGDLEASKRFPREAQLFSDLKNKFIKVSNLGNNVSKIEQRIVNDLLNNFLYYLQTFIDFTIIDGESVTEIETKRSFISNEFEKFVIDATKTLVGIIAYNQSPSGYEQELKNILTRSESLEASTKTNAETQNRVTAQQNQLIQQVNETKEKTTSLFDEMKKYASEVLAQTYGEIFSKEASNHRNIAAFSFGIFIILMICTAIYLCYFSEKILLLISPLSQIKNVIQLKGMIYGIGFEFVLKLSFFVLFYIGLKESLRNFGLNMNLYVLNRNKHNALLSFNVLMENSKHSNEIKDEVLRQVTSAIYSPSSTGYSDNKQEKGLNVSEIIDLVKALK